MVLTTPYFNAANVDQASLTLGNDDGNETPIAGKKKLTPAATLTDVDRDGDRDLVAEFEESRLLANGDLTPASTRLFLLGRLRSGGHLRGSDAVRGVPRPPGRATPPSRRSACPRVLTLGPNPLLLRGLEVSRPPDDIGSRDGPDRPPPLILRRQRVGLPRGSSSRAPGSGCARSDTTHLVGAVAPLFRW